MDLMQRARKLILRLLLAAFVAAGIYIAVVTALDFRLAIDATDWPATQGIVTKSKMHMGRSRRAWHEFLYIYEVDGRQYSGHRATLRDGLIRYKAFDRVQLYPVGRHVAVYYAPDQPSISVLETGIWWPGILFHVFAALLVTAVGGGGLFLTLR